MSQYVFYQPIDVKVIQEVVFPYILGVGSLDSIISACESPLKAEGEIRPFHDAYQALQQGNDYYDLQWGHCDPLEFISEGVVKGVLRFAGHLHPNWNWNYLTSIYFLGDEIPILNFYQMPITLFEPLAKKFPQLSTDLATIVSAEEIMSGVVKPEDVSILLGALKKRLHGAKRDPNDPYDFEFDAMAELEKALTYANEHHLSYTEMIE